MEDSIFALSTPAGGAIAVIRISGASAQSTLNRIFTGKLKPRYMAFGHIKQCDTVLDEAMAAFFPAPNSYTGEDMAEIYSHGGSAVVSSILELLACLGLRMAEPGEFTRRAFLNGKLDLAQSEAVMDVINASTRRSAAAALEQLRGSLSDKLKELESKLTDALSGVNAAIDYPEELEEDVLTQLPFKLNAVADELDRLISNGLKSRVLRDGVRVVISGKPNAGKSSLLNAMLGTERAIVTCIPGTTRDTLEERIDIGGIPVRLIDTAGIRDTEDIVEGIGIDRAKTALSEADLILLAFDGADGWTDEDTELIKLTADKPRIAALAKSDLPQVLEASDINALADIPVYTVSSLTGEGINELKTAISKVIALDEESALVTNARHIACLEKALAALLSAVEAIEADCIATDIREALLALAAITGSNADSKVIDRIFERFCVGK